MSALTHSNEKASLPRVASCSCCGIGITRFAAKNSGMCRPCGNRRRNADPTVRAHQRAGLKRKWASDPEWAAKMRKNAQRVGQKAALDEDLQERRRAWGKHVYATVLSRPEIVARTIEAVRNSGPAQSAAKLAWCPEEMRPRYRKLQRRIGATMARETVLAEWADIEAARSGKLVDAAAWLNRIAWTRQTADGFWQFGGTRLSAGQLFKTAKDKGWQG